MTKTCEIRGVLKLDNVLWTTQSGALEEKNGLVGMEGLQKGVSRLYSSWQSWYR